MAWYKARSDLSCVCVCVCVCVTDLVSLAWQLLQWDMSSMYWGHPPISPHLPPESSLHTSQDLINMSLQWTSDKCMCIHTCTRTIICTHIINVWVNHAVLPKWFKFIPFLLVVNPVVSDCPPVDPESQKGPWVYDHHEKNNVLTHAHAHTHARTCIHPPTHPHADD